MSWTKLLFSFEGQIGRPQFWKGMAVIAVFAVAAALLANALGTEYSPNAYVTGIALLIGWYMALALGAKRCRDRGRPAWVVLAALVPYAGQLWYLGELGGLPHRAPPVLTLAEQVELGERPFLTALGWFFLGLFSLQAVVFSMIMANAMQAAARNVEYEKAKCAREGNQNCYVSYYHGDVEAMKVALTVGSLICLAGLAWSRKLATNLTTKKK